MVISVLASTGTAIQAASEAGQRAASKRASQAASQPEKPAIKEHTCSGFS